MIYVACIEPSIYLSSILLFKYFALCGWQVWIRFQHQVCMLLDTIQENTCVTVGGSLQWYRIRNTQRYKRQRNESSPRKKHNTNLRVYQLYAVSPMGDRLKGLLHFALQRCACSVNHPSGASTSGPSVECGGPGKHTAIFGHECRSVCRNTTSGCVASRRSRNGASSKLHVRSTAFDCE